MIVKEWIIVIVIENRFNVGSKSIMTANFNLPFWYLTFPREMPKSRNFVRVSSKVS